MANSEANLQPRASSPSTGAGVKAVTTESTRSQSDFSGFAVDDDSAAKRFNGCHNKFSPDRGKTAPSVACATWLNAISRSRPSTTSLGQRVLKFSSTVFASVDKFLESKSRKSPMLAAARSVRYLFRSFLQSNLASSLAWRHLHLPRRATAACASGSEANSTDRSGSLGESTLND